MKKQGCLHLFVSELLFWGGRGGGGVLFIIQIDLPGDFDLKYIRKIDGRESSVTLGCCTRLRQVHPADPSITDFRSGRWQQIRPATVCRRRLIIKIEFSFGRRGRWRPKKPDWTVVIRPDNRIVFFFLFPIRGERNEINPNRLIDMTQSSCASIARNGRERARPTAVVYEHGVRVLVFVVFDDTFGDYERGAAAARCKSNRPETEHRRQQSRVFAKPAFGLCSVKKKIILGYDSRREGGENLKICTAISSRNEIKRFRVSRRQRLYKKTAIKKKKIIHHHDDRARGKRAED